nr:immunoglobulin light chain junction region [Macaca mulatta]
CQQGDSNPPTF